MIIHKIYNACICLILCICTTNLLATPTPPIQYQPTYLPSSGLSGIAINNYGEVVGVTSANKYFFYANGTIIDLSTLTGLSIHSARDINDHSQIVGVYSDSKNEYFPYVFSVLQNHMQTLQVPNDDTAGQPLSINNAGQIVGYVEGSSLVCVDYQTPCAAIFYTNKACQVLDRKYSQATHISDFYGSDGLGQIVGSHQSTAFLYSNGTMNIGINPHVCPQSTDYITSKASLNNVGQIVGDCNSNTGIQQYDDYGFVYNTTSSSSEYLGKSAIAPIAINDSGWIIGIADVNTNHAYPFLMIQGSLYDIYRLINTSYPINQLTLVDINNKGQILANEGATQYNGVRALILNPVCDANSCY